MNNILIWDAEGAPLAATGTTLFWRAFTADTWPGCVSIPRLIEENADALRARYLARIYELGELRVQGRPLVDHLQLRPGLSYWWMTLIAEKCNYEKSLLIADAIRFFAFRDWVVGRPIKKIMLASSNQALVKCFRVWCEKAGVAFEFQRLPHRSQNGSWIRRIFSTLPQTIQALAWFSHYVITRWQLRGVGLEQWERTIGQTTFVSYLFNISSEAERSGWFKSPYWERLPDDLVSSGRKTNWLHIYVKDPLLPNSGSAAKTIRKFNRSAQGLQRHVTLDTFLTSRVVLKALSDWLTLMWRSKHLQRIVAANEAGGIWPLLHEDWQESICGVTALNNLLSFNLFEAVMKSLPKQQVGVYLQENQGWEFGFIHAWRAAGHGHLIGVPHSSVRYWDLRYFFDPRTYSRSGSNPIPLPDQVALNGKAAVDAYLAGGYPASSLVEVEALRYLYLEKATTKTPAKPVESQLNFRLLVLGDYLASNTQLQMELLVTAAQSFPSEMAITVKPHPACPIHPEYYPSLCMTIVMKPIAELLAECDAAYTSAVTSAAVDAYCYGVPVVSALDATSLNMSPLRGYESVFFTSTSEELALALKSILGGSRIAASRKDFFTVDNRLPRWRKLLALQDSHDV